MYRFEIEYAITEKQVQCVDAPDFYGAVKKIAAEHGVTPKEIRIIESKVVKEYGRCKTCKHFWLDVDVNAAECDANMTDAEYKKYFEDYQSGCPHYEKCL